MKDLTKGKPSVLVFTFAVPIFFRKFTTIDIQSCRHTNRRLLSWRKCTCSSRSNEHVKWTDYRFPAWIVKWICHYHGTEIRRRRYRTNAEIICPVVSSWNRNFGILYCAWTCISATNSAILKYTGKIAANGKILHYYYHSRAACNLFI